MNNFNNFTATGNVVKDAEVKNLGKAQVIRFGIFINTTNTDKDGNRVQKSAIMNFERHIKAGDTQLTDILKKGKRVKVQGFFEADTWTDKESGEKRSRIKNVALSVEEIVKKEDDDSEKKEA